ncbi:MAG TPA: hypothetical protein VG387_02785 [Rhizomicrobium sp.]|jgi:hypothetical protein|nr:hypothetical protein [Rhizomicrobium sp.]
MRRLPLLALLCVTALPAAAQDTPFDPKLEGVIRCYDAAAVYAQIYVITGKRDAVAKLNGYASELKTRAYAIGDKDGRSRADVRSEFADNDSSYVHRFYIFGPAGMLPSEFGRGEIGACGLNKVLK